MLGVVTLTGAASSASALKMAYAAYTKGSSALLLAVNALAEAAGVRDALVQEWEISQPGLAKRSERTAAGTSRKAWRFVGEMQEIARTFAAAGLPDDFHLGAAELYRRMAELKDLPPAELEVVLQHILTHD
jgi:3-hydroxyisobutyrate dehydrogenase-like beta-hydroxyacid dehydrogenase